MFQLFHQYGSRIEIPFYYLEPLWQFLASLAIQSLRRKIIHIFLLYKKTQVILISENAGLCINSGKLMDTLGNLLGILFLRALEMTSSLSTFTVKQFLTDMQIVFDLQILKIKGTNILTFGLYWGVGLIYIIMDLTNRPKFLRKYKSSHFFKINKIKYFSYLKIIVTVQPGQNEPVDPKRLASVT